MGKARSFHCASVSKRDPLRWVRVWVKITGREDLLSRPAFFSLSYMTCSMKLPIVWAASSCFCRVAWV